MKQTHIYAFIVAGIVILGISVIAIAGIGVAIFGLPSVPLPSLPTFLKSEYVTGHAPGHSAKVSYEQAIKDRSWTKNTPQIPIPEPGEDVTALLRKHILSDAMAAVGLHDVPKTAKNNSNGHPRHGSPSDFLIFMRSSISGPGVAAGTPRHVTIQKGNSKLKVKRAICLAAPRSQLPVEGQATGFLILGDIEGETYGQAYNFRMIFQVRGLYAGDREILPRWTFVQLEAPFSHTGIDERFRFAMRWPFERQVDTSNYNRYYSDKPGRNFEGVLAIGAMHALDGVTFIRGDPPQKAPRTPHGIVASGRKDERNGASLLYFKQGRALGKPWLWVELPDRDHEMDRGLEAFARTYFEVILYARRNSESKSKGIWVDIDQGVQVDLLATNPTLTGWLPDESLFSSWSLINGH